MHARITIILFYGILLFALSGCGIFKSSYPTERTAIPGAGVSLTNHNPVSLQNYRAARAYSAEGRLELAREHYLLAYAAAGNDSTLRSAIEQELIGIDMMIKTLR